MFSILLSVTYVTDSTLKWAFLSHGKTVTYVTDVTLWRADCVARCDPVKGKSVT